MASVTGKGGKRPFVKFSVRGDSGRRVSKRIYVKVSWSVVEQEAAASHIHELSLAFDEARPERPRTTKWLSNLCDDMHARLAKKGLCQPRHRHSISQLCKFCEFVMERKKMPADGKPSKATTVEIYERTVRSLNTFFGKFHRIDQITESDVKAFRTWLRTEANLRTGRGLSLGESNKRLKNCREWFHLAVTEKILDKNPFAFLKGLGEGHAAKPDERTYIDSQTILTLIDDSHDNEWKLLLALWRFAGLRQVEPLELTLDRVSWVSDRITVFAPKNDRYPNKRERVIPIWPELRRLMLKQCEDAQEAGETNLIFKRRYKYDETKGTRKRVTGSSITSRLDDQLLRLGIPKRPEPFLTMRRSGEMDRTNQKLPNGDFAFHADDVAYWWNHKPEVQKKSYHTVTADTFKRASEPRDENEVNPETEPQEMSESLNCQRAT